MLNIKEVNQLLIGSEDVKLEQSVSQFFDNTITLDGGEDAFKISSKIRLKEDSRILNISQLFFVSSITEVRFFNRYSKWQVITKKETFSAYQFLFLEIRNAEGLFVYLYNNIPFACSVLFDHGELEFNIIHDAPYLHPTWDYSKGQRISTAMSLQSKGTLFNSVFFIKISRKTLNPIIPSFYPAGSKACFILTDHCDFDTTEKLKLFLYGNDGDGWLKKGLKITKGVFRYGPTINDIRKSDDLEISTYKNLIDDLKNDGSEICPHALKHSGQLTAEEFLEGMDFLYKNYHPRTWIDHGSYIKYCYSQNGHTNMNYNLFDVILNRNFNNLWSFHDVANDPTLSLNYFHEVKYSKRNGIRKIFGHLFRGNISYALHYFRSFIYKSFGKSLLMDFLSHFFNSSKSLFIAFAKKKSSIFEQIKILIEKLIQFNEVRNKGQEHFTLNQLNDYLSPLFTEDHRTINNYTKGLLFFNTIEATHTKDIYTETLLSRLVEERGLHLGHTYILNSLPYINGIFAEKQNRLVLSEEWIKFTRILSDKVVSEEIWNPNMGDFVERVSLLLKISFKLLDDGVRIVNHNDAIILGYTFLDSNMKEYVIDLTPFQDLTIRM